jgi:ribosomal protein S18 acetylase RimI-like enzyme
LRTRDENFFCWLRDFAAAMGFWGAQTAGLSVSAACRDQGIGTPLTLQLKKFSGTVVRQPQSGSLRSPIRTAPR